MKLIDIKQLTEKERHKLAVAAQKSRPSMKQRAEFRALMHRYHKLRAEHGKNFDSEMRSDRRR
jgi:hypothetical protein